MVTCDGMCEYKARVECAAVHDVGGRGGSVQKVHALPALRPAPPPYLAKVGVARSIGDKVDMLQNNAWWAGQVVAVDATNGTVTVQCLPLPYGYGEPCPGVALDHVRTRLEYIHRDECWRRVV